MIPVMIYVILGILFCIYGFMIRMVGSGTAFFMVWFACGILCFLYAAASGFGLWEKVPSPLRTASFAVFGAAALLILIVEGMILTRFFDRGEENPDYIIVLGAQIHETGPSVVLKYRLDKAAEFLKDNPQTLCIVSGGKGSNEPFPEAQGMRDYLVRQGIPEDRILSEDRSLNTGQNIRYSIELLEKDSIDIRKKRVGIITNNFHMFRGLSIAKKHGFEHVFGIAAGSKALYLPNNMLREFCGVCKDKLCGNL